MQQLGSQISAADLGRLVLTRTYDRLLAAAGTMTGTDIDGRQASPYVIEP